ncbi:hypothetical protein E4V01_15935 [Methylorubrum sp. Q1]|uniref:hypothetical protein n=1 Tax=Methylorubrum sp. Q1 TaxID=2562453 RepID=UPI001076B59C|nr:hypothetical protein [Methylorubrum sp. Q1]TFZ57127.1 hypothetical protein E4V01_15935 [Methylorubrum sp. Q1]
MALRTFQELIDLYPDLGPLGCREEARNCGPDPAVAPLLKQAADGYGHDLLEALEYWTRNNDRVVFFLVDRNENGDKVAKSNLMSARLLKLRNIISLYGDSIAVDEAEKAASACVETVSRHADLILQSFNSPLFPQMAVSVYRGTAIYRDELNAKFAPGCLIRHGLPLACTLNRDFVPLHFAWKRRNKLADREPGRPIASIILEIRPQAGIECPMLWSGHFKQQLAGADFRWQQEVLIPPNLSIKVETCDPMSNAELFHVRAAGELP